MKELWLLMYISKNLFNALVAGFHSKQLVILYPINTLALF